MTAHNEKKPAVICDGRLLRLREDPADILDATLTILDCSGNHLRRDPADAGAGEAYCAGGAGREVEDAAADEGAAVVDGDDDAAAAMGDPEPGAERQTAVSRGHGVLVEARSGGGLAAGFVAVKGSHAGEAAAGAAAHGRVGVTPGRIAGMMGVMMMMMMAVMVPVRFSRSFGDAPTEQQSCGEKRKRRTRPGTIFRCRLLEF